MLRAFAIAAGICCSIFFVVIGLRYELQIYGDGAMFSYAAAVQDAWAFHWHQALHPIRDCWQGSLAVLWCR